MEHKRKSPELITEVFRTKGTTSIKRKRGHLLNGSFTRIETENLESEANRKLNKSARCIYRIQLDGRAAVIWTLRSAEFDKVKSGHPSYVYFSDTDRTKVINYLREWINIPSRVLAYVMNVGLNPAQIGAIRRWHREDWRVLLPKI